MKKSGYKRTLYTGMIIIAPGVVISTTLSEKVGPLGIVFVAVGGLLFILGSVRKRNEESSSWKE